MTTFHVRHDFSPDVARDALAVLRMTTVSDEQHLLELARARDLEIGQRQSAIKVLASLRDLELVERASARHGAGICLTSLGVQIADIAIRDELFFAELIHLAYWWRWTPEHGGEGFAWAYQTVAGMLWDEAPTTIDNDRLVATVLTEAEAVFGVKGASFSSSSILGILHWLRALSPPCVVAKGFRPRPTCSPDALIIALNGIAAAQGQLPGVPLRLDTITRQRACRTVLIDTEGFDEVLAQAEETPGLIRRRSDGSDMILLRELPFPGLVAAKVQR
jgi:hypothetical protein